MNGASKIIKALEDAGFAAYIVGGAVRDILLGKEPHDLDIVTSARPDMVEAVAIKSGFACMGTVGKSFGVVIVQVEGNTYEVATYRTERYGADSHRPEEVQYANTLEEDLQRRDFTINALVMDGDGNIHDLVGGKKDLKNKCLRTIGNAEGRFNEDALRLFRACRFIGQLGFRAHPSLVEGMAEAFPRVRGLSLERVRNELDKLIVAPYVAKGLDVLVRSKLAEQSCRIRKAGNYEERAILPEFAHLVGLPQERSFHAFDGWVHTLAVTQAVPPDPIIRWAALFHDVGKGMPNIRAIRKGRLTDYGHDILGAEMAATALTRLEYPRQMVSRIKWIVKNHMRFHFFGQHNEADPWKWMRKEVHSGDFHSTEELVEACHQLMEVCIGDVIGCGKPYSATEGTRAFGECLMDIAGQLPIHTRDLKYDRDLPLTFKEDTGDVLKSLLGRVQNRQLENNPEALRKAAEDWRNRRILLDTIEMKET